MLGYSEEKSIYFSIQNHTGYAKLKHPFEFIDIQNFSHHELESCIETGCFTGIPQFKFIDFKKGFSFEHKQCHAAEHKTYKAFKKNIRNLKSKTQYEDFKYYIPSLEEIKNTNSFSIFCGTSFIISSTLATLTMALPNILKYKNNDIYFMSFWILFSLCEFYFCSKIIQKKYLSEPNHIQILLAQKALKEALNGNNNKPNTCN